MPDRASYQNVNTVAIGEATADRSASATATTSSSTVVPANAERRYLTVQNLSTAETVTVSLVSPAVAGAGLVLGPGQGWEMPTDAPYTGAVYVIATGSASLAVTEY